MYRDIVQFNDYITEIEIKSALKLEVSSYMFCVKNGNTTYLRITFIQYDLHSLLPNKINCEYYGKRDHLISVETLKEIYPFLLIYANNKSLGKRQQRLVLDELRKVRFID